MSRLSALSAHLILLSALVGGAVHAQSGSTVIQTQIKGALNEMVQDVHSAPTAHAKREVMDRFVTTMDQRVTLIGNIPFLSDDHQAALQHLQTRFDGYAAAIRGTSTTDHAKGGVVADSDLDAYATFMQNDLEQAQNGGIFLSTGAIIILLLILILIL